MVVFIFLLVWATHIPSKLNLGQVRLFRWGAIVKDSLSGGDANMESF